MKYYCNSITGEVCDTAWEVLKSTAWWLTHYHKLNNITVKTHLKYVFAWERE